MCLWKKKSSYIFVAINLGAQLQFLLTPQTFTRIDINTEPLVNQNETMFIIGIFLRKECVGGWYGLDCHQRCSGHCRDNAVCCHVTGQCDGGCTAGWRGALCDKGKSRIFSEIFSSIFLFIFHRLCQLSKFFFSNIFQYYFIFCSFESFVDKKSKTFKYKPFIEI